MLHLHKAITPLYGEKQRITFSILKQIVKFPILIMYLFFNHLLKFKAILCKGLYIKKKHVLGKQDSKSHKNLSNKTKKYHHILAVSRTRKFYFLAHVPLVTS